VLFLEKVENIEQLKVLESKKTKVVTAECESNRG
jgi:CMP-2-keto-3-deoxyoctulosonic acid synthetase